MLLFHRTSVSQARAIVRDGFEDEQWTFGAEDPGGDPLQVVGVWLTDRPVTSEEGVPGAALVEVSLEVPEGMLLPFEVGGVFEETRLFVVPARLVNQRAAVRIGEVDARSSWFYKQVEDDGEEGLDGAGEFGP